MLDSNLNRNLLKTVLSPNKTQSIEDWHQNKVTRRCDIVLTRLKHKSSLYLQQICLMRIKHNTHREQELTIYKNLTRHIIFAVTTLSPKNGALQTRHQFQKEDLDTALSFMM